MSKSPEVREPRSSRAKSRGAGTDSSHTPLDYARDERAVLTCRKALSAAVRRLADISDTPRLDAELLMAHALGLGRESLLLSRLDHPGPGPFEPLLRRHEAAEPGSSIPRRTAFWSLAMAVGPGGPMLPPTPPRPIPAA